MSEPAKQIQIHRERGFFGVFRKLIIKVDGVELLRIKSGETLDLKLPAGASEMTLQMDWISTEAFDLTPVAANDVLVIFVLKRSFRQMRSLIEIPFAIRIA